MVHDDIVLGRSGFVLAADDFVHVASKVDGYFDQTAPRGPCAHRPIPRLSFALPPPPSAADKPSSWNPWEHESGSEKKPVCPAVPAGTMWYEKGTMLGSVARREREGVRARTPSESTGGG